MTQDRKDSCSRILIACSMIEDELLEVVDRCRIEDLEIRWMERGHHSDPEKLHQVIQQEIDRAEADGAEEVLLAYGLCGNGAVGWRTKKAVLVMPRFDDCVNMMLCTGCRDRRNYLEAGQMYLTRGWMHDEGALLGMLDDFKKRYGERKGRKAMKLMLDSYDKVTIIETGCFDPVPVRAYADRCAE